MITHVLASKAAEGAAAAALGVRELVLDLGSYAEVT